MGPLKSVICTFDEREGVNVLRPDHGAAAAQDQGHAESGANCDADPVSAQLAVHVM